MATSTGSRGKSSLLPKPSPTATLAAARKKHLVSESKKLELENAQMEGRLSALKEYLQSQKEKRLSSQDTLDAIWRGAHSTKGSLKSYGSDVLVKRRLSSGGKGKAPSGLPVASATKEPKSPAPPPPSSKILTPTPPSAPKVKESSPSSMWRIPSSLGRHTPNTDSPKQQQGLMSYQDQLASVKSKTRKSVPFPVRSDQYEEEEQEESLSNLLDGEYDEKESHAAFQRALNEWRGVPTKEQEVKEVVDKVVKSNAGINANTGCNANTGTQSAKTPSVAESQLKDLLERSAMDKGLSYLDKLLLDKYRSESGVNKEDALDQKLEKLRSLSLNDQSELVLSQLNEPTWQEEEEEELNLHDESFPLVGFEGEEEFTIQDITQCTEDSIQESLKAGRMIEVLPSSVCTIEESSR